MKKYVFVWLIYSFLPLLAQLSPHQRFQDINVFTSVITTESTILVSTDKNKLLRTTNAGESWSEITANIPQGIIKLYDAGGSVIFGCGKNGAAIRSNDNGESWVQLTTPTNVDLFSITAIGASTVLASGAGGTILRSQNNGDDWVTIQPGVYNINDIKFVDSQIGWIACDSGIIMKTIDGGINWAEVPTDTANCNFGIISLYNNDGIVIMGREGQVFVSTNAGLEWKYDYKPIYLEGDTVVAAWHYSRDTVIFVDDTGTLIRFIVRPDQLSFSRFGGNLPEPARYTAAYRAADHTMYLAGEGPTLCSASRNTTVRKTQFLSQKGLDLRNLCFLSENVGLMSGHRVISPSVDDNLVFATIDGGKYWKLSVLNQKPPIFHIRDDKKLIMAKPLFWLSNDTARTWVRQNHPQSLITDVIFRDTINGYLTDMTEFPTPTGSRGRFYITINGGASWVLKRTFFEYFITSLSADRDGRVWIAEDGNARLNVSKDGGYSFSEITLPSDQKIVGTVIGQKGFLVFKNGQIAFSPAEGFVPMIVYTATAAVFNAVSNSIDGRALVVGNAGRILATADHGANWVEINSGSTQDFTAAWILSDFSYLVGTKSGVIYKGDAPAIFTDIENDATDSPVEFTLGNYPNPFNSSTVIYFTLPKDMECKFEVFSTIGSLVHAEFINGQKGHNTLNFNASGMESAVYIYRITAEGKSLTGKMVLLK